MTPRCDNQVSSIGPCNTPLTVTTNGFGKVLTSCPRCTARAAGRCWQCGKPRTNHPEFGVYCEPCRKAAAKRTYQRCQQSPEYKAWLQAYHADRRQHDPVYIARKREINKRWREQNPDRVKANWQRFAAKRRSMKQQDGAA